jgi:hypothetical protein
MAELGRLAERGVNREQGYRFLSDDDVLDALRPRLAAAGLDLAQEVHPDREPVVEVRATRSGGQQEWWRVWFLFTLTHAPSGEQEKTLWLGCAADSADKGFPKAATAAAKHYQRHRFLLSAGQETDPDASSPQGRPAQAQARRRTVEGDRLISKAQTERLWARARKAGVEEGTVRRIVDYATAGEARDEEGAPHVGRLTKAHYDRFVDLVERYPREEAEAVRELRRWQEEERLVEGAAQVLDGSGHEQGARSHGDRPQRNRGLRPRW